jgi:hypothetical protein
MNIGFVTGAVSGNLLVVDFDSEIIARLFYPKFDDLIASTMTVKTGRGYHCYFRLPSPTVTTTFSFYRAGDRDDRGRPKAYQSVTIKAEGGYVVGPGSTHPNGKTYELITDREPTLMENAPEFLAKLKARAKKVATDNEWALGMPKADRDPETFAEYVKLLPKLEELVGDGLIRSGGELSGPHPVHGSETGKNFHVNIDRQVWYCFRCQKGGGVLSWLAVKHGLINCEKADKLPKGIYPELFEKIKEIYHVSPPVKEEEKKYCSFLETDNKIVEEIMDPSTNSPRFVVYDILTEKYEYQSSFMSGTDEMYPFPLEEGESRSLGLPSGIMEYNDLKELRKELLEWALEEFDPVSNHELFELIINLSLTSWITEWQEGFGEKFLSIIQAVGPSETGKKRFLTVMRFLFYRSVYALKTTKVPSLFRLMEKWRGTLVLDEADLDDSTLSAEFVQFVNSRADGVPITRYDSESNSNKFFYSFGYTILAMRKSFTDDGAQSRCLKYVSEGTNTPADYDLIPPKDWVRKGEELRQKLMLFRLRCLGRPHKFPTQLLIEGVTSFRVREAVLMLSALEPQDQTITTDIPRILKVLQRQAIEERAGSTEGLILNVVYGWLTDEEIIIERKPTGWYVKNTLDKYRKGEKFEEIEPLTLSQISEALKESLPASEIARYWRGLGQDLLAHLRIGQRKKRRGVLLIKDPKRLQKEFRKYVVDAEEVTSIFIKQTSLEGLEGREEPPVNDKTPPEEPDGTSLKLSLPDDRPSSLRDFQTLDTRFPKADSKEIKAEEPESREDGDVE